MWEEYPRWQEGNYRLLVWLVIIGVSGTFILSLWTGEWETFFAIVKVLGVLTAALCVYAATLWTVGHLGLFLWSMLKKLRGNRRQDS
jgi:hypothetical protein